MSATGGGRWRRGVGAAALSLALGCGLGSLGAARALAGDPFGTWNRGGGTSGSPTSGPDIDDPDNDQGKPDATPTAENDRQQQALDWNTSNRARIAGHVSAGPSCAVAAPRPGGPVEAAAPLLPLAVLAGGLVLLRRARAGA
jgi:hypothetical protein